MKYLLSIYVNDATLHAIENELREEFEAAHGSVQTELRASGEFLDSKALSDDGSKVVRTGGERMLVTDGPFTEGKEWVGGFYLVDCASLDRAIEIAGRFVEARFSPVEVRALA